MRTATHLGRTISLFSGTRDLAVLRHVLVEIAWLLALHARQGPLHPVLLSHILLGARGARKGSHADATLFGVAVEGHSRVQHARLDAARDHDEDHFIVAEDAFAFRQLEQRQGLGLLQIFHACDLLLGAVHQ